MIAALLLVLFAQTQTAPPAPPAAVVAARTAIDADGKALVQGALALFDADRDGFVRALQARAFDVDDADSGRVVATRAHEGATRTLGFCIVLDDAPAAAVEPARFVSAQGEALTMPDAAPVDRSARFVASRLAGRAELAALLTAIDALDAAHVATGAHLLVVLDESGHLGGRGGAGDPLPAADVWFVLAGQPYPSSRATLAFGARGHVDVDLEVFGATRAVSAGTFGGLAPNPAIVLAIELASMRDDRGSVLIAGFYDDLVDLPDAALIAQANDASDEIDLVLPEWFGVAELELLGATIGSIAMRPALDVVAMGAALPKDFDERRRYAMIPPQAGALLRLSTIEGQSRTRAVAKVASHLVDRGWLVLDRDPTPKERAERWRIAKLTTRVAGFDARRTQLDHPIVQPIFNALFAIEQRPPVVMPQLGEALDLGWLTLREGGAYVVLPHGLARDGLPRDDGTIGAWFRCVETMAAAIDVGARG